MARSLSPAAHESILNAFLKLMEDNAVDDITTEAIAREAEASKSTLYKHWKNKEALLVDVVRRLVKSQPVLNSGDYRADVMERLRDCYIPRKNYLAGRAWPTIFSYAFTHPEFCQAVHKTLLVHAPERTLMGILKAAAEAGVLRQDLDPEFMFDLLSGPLMHHRFLHGNVPSKLVEQVVMTIWPTLQP